MSQLSLPLDLVSTKKPQGNPGRGSFSHNGVCDESARILLEQKYAHLIEETDRFSRQTVSFQANKINTLHRWVKYREGFSAQLVEMLLSEFDIQPGHAILDPFAGSCTTLLEAKLNGIDATGVELLPHCHLAWEAKSRVFDYDVSEIEDIRTRIRNSSPPPTGIPFPHLNITDSAFPQETANAIVDYAAWFQELPISQDAKTLCQALLMSVLEDVSYTRKDGQYLRWDGRADKIVNRNKARSARGQKLVKGIDKGELPSLKSSLLSKFTSVISDIVQLQAQRPPDSRQELIRGNTLHELPLMQGEIFDAVITSPPYANRYDYTRTYALELAYLDVGQEIFRLRQNLLSCTVENKPKDRELDEFYRSIGAYERYLHIMTIVQNNAALHEVNAALKTRNSREEINNSGVLRMIDQYFMELAFVYAELFRICKPGAHIVFVNDNVRYAGEVIPVDMISTDLAEMFGFVPVKIYVLHQKKGNSSQQMKKFGRRELRKSVTIWRKPNSLNARI